MQHRVFIPALHRDLTDGHEMVTVEGESVAEVVTQLEARYPGLEARLCAEGRIRPHIAVAINGEVTRRGLRQKLDAESEIHFIPALSGG
ncbi:MAG: MoaD/ThiS family protein [Caldilineaceae bacterium]|jgi:molybdopterin synthase sulfur carrier subunit|nr:MoaD/ThiS family protein [Caldilineaceae bacterium]